MTSEALAPFDWDHLTDLQASILEAYFSLYQGRDPTALGSQEILQWFRERDRTAPSESLIRTVLAAAQAPRRSVGRPSNESRAPAGAPLLPPVRTQPPKSRHPSRR